MSPVTQPPRLKNSLHDALGGLSKWPDHPFRMWTRPGCQFSIVKTWQHETEPQPFFEYNKLKASDVAQDVLVKSASRPNRQKPGIRVLIIEGSADDVDPSMEDLQFGDEHKAIESTFEAFGLSVSSGALLSLGINTPTNSDLLQLGGYADRRSVTHFLGHPYHSLLWSFNHEENMTSAILRADVPEMNSADYIAYLLERHEYFLQIPLFLPYLVCYLSVNSNGDMVNDVLNEIRLLESESGFHNWSESGTYLSQVSLVAELSAASKKASGLAAAACSRKTDVSMLQNSVRSLIHRCQLNESDSVSYSKEQLLLWAEMQECFNVLDGVLTSQGLFAEEVHQRALIQQSAVFHVVAQRDQGSSLEIARDSQMLAVQGKRDTVSMETMAFLSMLILPAGFTAVRLLFN